MDLVIEYLTDAEDTRRICRQYWQLDDDGKFALSLKSIAENNAISQATLRASVSQNCRAYTLEESCGSCGSPRPLHSRAEFQQFQRYGRWQSWTCGECISAAHVEDRRQRELEEKTKRELLQRDLNIQASHGLLLEALSFEDCVYLLSLIRHAASDDLSHISPISSISSLLSPTRELDREILVHLYQQRVICIHPGSKSATITIEDGEFTSFQPLDVHWILPLKQDESSPLRFLEKLESAIRSDDWLGDWIAESQALHRKVALHECLQYLRVVMEEHGFEFKSGDKTKQVLRSVLKHFSIAQVYSFMWRAAKDAASFYVRKSTSKSHAANTVPGSIQRMADHALAEGWDVRGYRRDFRSPQSTLSQVLFDAVLKLGDRAFTIKPPLPLAEDEDEDTDADD